MLFCDPIHSKIIPLAVGILFSWWHFLSKSTLFVACCIHNGVKITLFSTASCSHAWLKAISFIFTYKYPRLTLTYYFLVFLAFVLTFFLIPFSFLLFLSSATYTDDKIHISIHKNTGSCFILWIYILKRISFRFYRLCLFFFG